MLSGTVRDYFAFLKIRLFSIYGDAMCTNVAMDTCLTNDSIFGMADERL